MCTPPQSFPTDGGAPYWEMDVYLPSEAEEVWSLFCYDRGACGAEQMASGELGLRMRYFFEALPPEAEQRTHWIDAFRAAYPGASVPVRIVLHRRPARDWRIAWREHFTPTPVGRRLVVCPPWSDAACTGSGTEKGVGRLPLIIDPGQGFGTGGHASTVLALELIETALSAQAPPAAMLDVGMGSGILAISAALQGVGELWGLEIDPRTFPEVRRNFQLNKLTPALRLVRGKPDCLSGGFPLVAANLTAPILRDFVKELVRLVSPGGALVISGMLAVEAPAVEAEFTNAGCRPVEIAQREGWYACRLLRSV